MTDLPTIQAQQLNPLSFPLHGSRLIEASAGTGKTFTIALLYVRLVLGQGLAAEGEGRPLLPREILVVTFTELAAGELRDRIRARLVEAAAYFLDDSLATEQMLVDLRKDYPQERWKECAWRLQMASESIDEASISTIHSWCNRMLVEHAFDSRGLFDRTLETDTRELLEEVAQDYWRKHFYPLNPKQARLVNGAFSSPADLLYKLGDLLRPGYSGLSFYGEPVVAKPLDKLFGQLDAAYQELNVAEQAMREDWRQNWDEISAHLLELRDGLKTVKKADRDPEAFDAILAEIHRWLEEGGDFPSYLDSFASDRFEFLKSAKIQQARDLSAFERTRHYNETRAGVDAQEAYLPPALLSHAASWVADEYRQRKSSLSWMTQDDLIVELERALDPAINGDHARALASSIRKNFPVAMVDEFQDTDPLQYRIFDRVYEVKANHPELGLFMIGDPKQSIYAFRGADINSYLAVRADTAGRHYTLKTNFRSTAGVVEACNAFFLHAEAHDTGAFQYCSAEGNPIPYVEVDANGRDDQLFLDGKPAQSLTLWHFDRDPDADEDMQGISRQDYIDRTVEQSASQIARWLRDAAQGKAGFGEKEIKKALLPADIAVIVRDRNEAGAVTRALQRRNIRSVYLSDRESLFASQEAKDCLHWLHACAEPSNESGVKTALGTASMQIPLHQLAAWLDDELAWEAIMFDFAGLHAIWRRQGVMVMLRRLLERFEVPQRLVQGRNERSLTNLLHLAEWLQEVSGQFDGEQALIRHLAEQLGQGGEEDLLRLESDAQRIRILTIHKSKGLEFPVVLLPCIGNWKPVDGYTKQVTWRRDGRKYVEVAGKEAFVQGWNAANRERIREDLRLLYVAMTRSSYALFLGTGPLLNRGKKIQLHDSALGHILNAGNPFKTAEEVRTAIETLAKQCGTEAVLDPQAESINAPDPQLPALEPGRAAPQLGNLFNWWVASYSALKFAGQDSDRATIEPESARQDQLLEYRPESTAEEPVMAASASQSKSEGDCFLHDFPRGARWGTFLHGLLEWAAQAKGASAGTEHLHGFAAAVADDAQRLSLVARRCRLRGIEDKTAKLSDWLKDFLQFRWPTGFALHDIAPGSLAVEMEFLLEVHQARVEEIDHLIRRHMQVPDEVAHARPATLNGMLKGFIDLVVEHQDRYFVIDWKSNYLGDSDADYSRERMQKAMYEHRYDVQYVLYTLALHRHLRRRLPEYDYDRHLGGVIYCFIRGSHNPHTHGLFDSKPPKALIEALNALCSKASKEKQGREHA